MRIVTPNYGLITPTNNVVCITATMLTVKDENKVKYSLYKADITIEVEESGSTTNINIEGFTLIKP